MRVSLDPGQEDVPHVVADEGQLRQVLTNLIDNAVKYSPDGGDVRVRLVPAGNYVRFTVADEGLGIPPAEQGRIFEKFYRLDPDMTGGIGGTGWALHLPRARPACSREDLGRGQRRARLGLPRGDSGGSRALYGAKPTQTG